MTSITISTHGKRVVHQTISDPKGLCPDLVRSRVLAMRKAFPNSLVLTR